jgi:nitrite reductase (NADH) small subunit
MKVHVGELTDFPQGRGRRVTAGNKDIAIWHVDETLYALTICCPHQHHPVMHEGILKGKTITCPMHGWTFSLTDGKASSGEGRLRIYPIGIEDGQVCVEIPEE